MLRQRQAELWALREAGIGTEAESKFIEALDYWVQLESDLRYKHHYRGCIWEPEQQSCEPAAVVRCSHCDTQSFFHAAAEGRVT